MIINKRIKRDLRNNIFRYLSIFILIFLGLFIVINIASSSETVIVRVNEYGLDNKVEDGQFILRYPLDEKNLETIRALGVSIEEQFYMDFTDTDERTVRVYKARKEINQEQADIGSPAANQNDVMLEKLFAKNHDYELGKTITINGIDLNISGIGTSPDYDDPLQELSDIGSNTSKFGTAFVTEHMYKILAERRKESSPPEVYQYSFRLNEKMSFNDFREYVKNLKVINNYGEFSANDIMLIFLSSDNNPRIAASAIDCETSSTTCMVIAILVVLICNYMISVFIINNIEAEMPMIGTLYALGIKKGELLRHYLCLPLAITFIGCVMGTAMGIFSMGLGIQPVDVASRYSIPDMKNYYPLKFIVFGILVPPIIAFLTNIFAINKKLKRKPLQLMRREQKEMKTSRLKLKKFSFINGFRIRQFIKELRVSGAVFVGIFLTIFLLMMGIDTYVMLNNLISQNEEDIRFNYMYSIREPLKEEIPSADIGYMKTFQKEFDGYTFNITMLGISEDNKYFDMEVPKEENSIIMSSSAALKFGIKEGDKFIIYDENAEKEYEFTVSEIVQYSAGLYLFADIDLMRKMYEKEDGYYNTIFSADELDIATDNIAATTTKESMVNVSKDFMNQFMGMIVMIAVLCIVFFVVVMYLMVKVMIDRSGFGISLMKVFGYRNGEIKKLYLDGNFFTVLVSTILSVPICKYLMDMIMPSFVKNVATGFDLSFSILHYAIIFLFVFAVYFGVNTVILRRLGKISPAEVLKNRE
ncbi:ABC transporter permease [Anaerocolumna xylanovorans]|uniref:Putative ABC transport system permease protein n=1 Tax=Anaerocolumna xylanovorans DSM 12503 TaxID=1121345 RepID=A0A1M7YIA3_9FIRM|nr:ABC transporter permease [Anaerocolumna xylanovorans]SHO52333.1 putative ABC transport system permease protein [Anaerocolumna xylanovorans DSM 12503]